MTTTELLVIGAGPYGLSAAAAAKAAGIQVMVVGEPMAFWKHNMPRGMLLRSGLDWHLDPAGIHTLEAFLEQRAIPRAAAEPMTIEMFCDYAEWFRRSKEIAVRPMRVDRVRRAADGLEVTFQGGAVVHAERVVAAPGLAPFVHIPAEISARVPSERLAHTATLVDFRQLAGTRCLIVGGRQSAFEWAALMVESGVESVDLVFRHDTPRFAPSDWSFTDAMIENTLREHGWFRRLSQGEQEAIHRCFWSAGRLQLEPWLWPRIDNQRIRIRPNAQIVEWRTTSGGEIEVRLERGEVPRADKVVCATGYRMDLARVRYLADAVASGELEVERGIPVLDEEFQTTVPGLYIVGQASIQHFGPLFGFLRGCIASARIVVASMQSEQIRA